MHWKFDKNITFHVKGFTIFALHYLSTCGHHILGWATCIWKTLYMIERIIIHFLKTNHNESKSKCSFLGCISIISWTPGIWLLVIHSIFVWHFHCLGNWTCKLKGFIRVHHQQQWLCQESSRWKCITTKCGCNPLILVH